MTPLMATRKVDHAVEAVDRKAKMHRAADDVESANQPTSAMSILKKPSPDDVIATCPILIAMKMHRDHGGGEDVVAAAAENATMMSPRNPRRPERKIHSIALRAGKA